MKIKPDDIKIPCENPFEHDLLNRKSTILALSNLLQNLETPYTMSIDASWGSGKTTFLKMWKQHLKNENFPVVDFNAWETDFAGNPLVALTSELITALESYGKEHEIEFDAPVKKIRTLLWKIVPTASLMLSHLFSYLTNTPVDISIDAAIASGAMTGVAAAQATKIITEGREVVPSEPLTYLDIKSTIEEFKSELKRAAHMLSEQHDDRPLVIAIDELDRCRPPYAIELLEIAKHLFSVDNIVFVLAIDKSQLSHAIKAIYGGDFDATGYLRRFIDLDFRLPDPDRKEFASKVLLNTLDMYRLRDPYQIRIGDDGISRSLFSEFLNASPLSLRQIQQVTIRLGLAIASVNPQSPYSVSAFILMSLLKAVDPALCGQFIRSEISDRDVCKQLFNSPKMQDFKRDHSSLLFEALLIRADEEFRKQDMSAQSQISSELYEHYTYLTSHKTDSTEVRRAESVLQILYRVNSDHARPGPAFVPDYGNAVEHIDLLHGILSPRDT